MNAPLFAKWGFPESILLFILKLTMHIEKNPFIVLQRTLANEIRHIIIAYVQELYDKSDRVYGGDKNAQLISNSELPLVDMQLVEAKSLHSQQS